MYCILKSNGGFIRFYDKLEDIVEDFPIEISDNGVVTFMGEEDTMSYNMNEFTKEGAIKDVFRTRLSKLLNIHSFAIYSMNRL